MKVCCISDMHGKFPEIPPCDLLLISGDICPVYDHSLNFQELWLNTDFINWRGSQPVRHCIICAGNHDFVLEKNFSGFRYHPMLANPTWLRYLQDSSVKVEGLKIWGSPWQKPFFNWAFNMPEEGMAKKWAAMPDDVDIIISHGPPLGYGDYAPRAFKEDGTELPTGEHTGSPSMLKRIQEVQPSLVCYGHIHAGRGQWQLGKTILVNATVVNERYQLAFPAYTFDLDKR